MAPLYIPRSERGGAMNSGASLSLRSTKRGLLIDEKTLEKMPPLTGNGMSNGTKILSMSGSESTKISGLYIAKEKAGAGFGAGSGSGFGAGFGGGSGSVSSSSSSSIGRTSSMHQHELVEQKQKLSTESNVGENSLQHLQELQEAHRFITEEVRRQYLGAKTTRTSTSALKLAPVTSKTVTAAAATTTTPQTIQGVESGGKRKFKFEWGDDEDTSEQIDPVYKWRWREMAMANGREKNANNNNNTNKRREIQYHQQQHKESDREKRERQREMEREKRKRHWSEKRLEEMEERDWRIFREDFSITYRSGRAPHPLRKWEEAGFEQRMMERLLEVGYKEPTPIQRAAIPCQMKNMDVVGIAETGSGKTAAFLLPMFVYIMKQEMARGQLAQDGPHAVVMAPTRELAAQIHAECDKLGSVLGIRSVHIVGGVSIEEQGVAMREGVEVVIATPGRLCDCIDRRYLVLNQCKYVVMDEADRMIDMNFEKEIKKILDAMPSSNMRPENPDEQQANYIYRQTVMFSATMPPKVEQLTRNYLRHPVLIAVGDRKGKAAASVVQHVEWVPSDQQKRNRLLQVINSYSPPILVFSNAKRACDQLGKLLEQHNISCAVLHGGKSQDIREQSLDSFKKGDIDVLVATDVMGRGIDVEGVELVINYDVPSTIDKYTHRIGRTGRAGRSGVAISFINEADSEIFYDLNEMMRQTGQHVPSQLAQHEATKFKMQRRSRQRDDD